MADTPTKTREHKLAEAQIPAQETAEMMVEVARRAMDQGQEAIRLTLRAITAAQTPVAEGSLAHGVRFSDNLAEIAQIYLQATERTAGDLESLALCYGQIGQAMQHWQTAAADLMQRLMKRAGDKPQSVFSCKSVTELAQWQHDMYAEMLGAFVSANHAMLQLTSQVAQNAMRPLERDRRPL